MNIWCLSPNHSEMKTKWQRPARILNPGDSLCRYLCMKYFDIICPPVAEVFWRSSSEFLYCIQWAEYYDRVPKQGHRMDVAVPDFISYYWFILHWFQNVMHTSNYCLLLLVFLFVKHPIAIHCWINDKSYLSAILEWETKGQMTTW